MSVKGIKNKFYRGVDIIFEDNLYFYKAEVLRVIDGDSIEAHIDLGFNIFKRIDIRLAGIDAPEIRTKDDREKKAGNLVTDYLVRLLSKYDNKIYVSTEQIKQGSFKRYIAYIYLPEPKLEKSINQILLDKEFAREYYSGSYSDGWTEEELEPIFSNLEA